MAPDKPKSRAPQWDEQEPWETQPTKRLTTKPRLKGLRDISRNRTPRQWQQGPWQHERPRRASDHECESEIAELQARLDALTRQRGSGSGYQSSRPGPYRSQASRKPAIGFQTAADNLSGRNGPVAFIIAFIALLILFATCIPVVVIGG